MVVLLQNNRVLLPYRLFIVAAIHLRNNERLLRCFVKIYKWNTLWCIVEFLSENIGWDECNCSLITLVEASVTLIKKGIIKRIFDAAQDLKCFSVWHRVKTMDSVSASGAPFCN